MKTVLVAGCGKSRHGALCSAGILRASVKFRGVVGWKPALRHCSKDFLCSLPARLAWVCVSCVLITGFALAGQYCDVSIEHNVEATMRDSIILRADVYRPKEEGKFPVILERTPYDKRELVQPGMYGVDLGLVLAAHGYVYILQDCRGRFSSEGEWYPFKHESEDGYDTVEWAARLPYANGKVGMVGGSYLGATQMLTAITAPPHLVGILPMFTASNYHDGWTYQGGAFEQ